MGRIDRGHAEPRREDAVIRRGRTAALDMAENHRSRLEPGSALDLTLELLADPPQPHVAELILPRLDGLHRPLLRHRALGGDDDREEPPAGVAPADQPADVVEVERPLGREDDVAAAGNPSVERDPSGVPPHHLDDHHPVVRLGSGVEPVDRLGGDLERGVEAERRVRGAKVVVDRLWNPDDVHSVLCMERRGGAERVLAPDRDQPVEVQALHRLPHPRRAVVVLQGVRARRPEDRPAARQDPPRRLDRQLLGLVLDRSAPTVAKADDGVPVEVDPLADDRADGRVQARAVPASGEHADAHGRTLSPRRARRPEQGRFARAGHRPLRPTNQPEPASASERDRRNSSAADAGRSPERSSE